MLLIRPRISKCKHDNNHKGCASVFYHRLGGLCKHFTSDSELYASIFLCGSHKFN
nr:MAG TPA: hypothetical protein [Caudoviricetes sp.]